LVQKCFWGRGQKNTRKNFLGNFENLVKKIWGRGQKSSKNFRGKNIFLEIWQFF
jgi:hypothetical protein